MPKYPIQSVLPSNISSFPAKVKSPQVKFPRLKTTLSQVKLKSNLKSNLMRLTANLRAKSRLRCLFRRSVKTKKGLRN